MPIKKLKLSFDGFTYNIEITRNITILNDYSGTGKTKIVKLLELYQQDEAVDIMVESNFDYAIIPLASSLDAIETYFSTNVGNVIFIDEGNLNVKTKDFACVLKKYKCFVVFINREVIHTLPYSYKEIYLLTKDDDQINMVQKYYYANDLKKVCRNTNCSKPLLLPEDEKGAYSVLHKIFGNICVKGKGKSYFKSFIKEMENEANIVYLLLDGAAFGSLMPRLLNCIRRNKDLNFIVYLPESFEYLVLKSNMFIDTTYYDELENTELYVGSDYLSWGRYFTALLELKAIENGYTYLKNNCDFLLEDKYIKSLEEYLKSVGFYPKQHNGCLDKTAGLSLL